MTAEFYLYFSIFIKGEGEEEVCGEEEKHHRLRAVRFQVQVQIRPGHPHDQDAHAAGVPRKGVRILHDGGCRVVPPRADGAQVGAI